MKFSRNPKFFSLVIPLTLSQWVPLPMGKEPLPSVVSEGKSWKIQTKGNAGGFTYLESGRWKPQPQFSWKWRVTQHPLSAGSYPEKKTNDDYAIRVGFLLSGDGKISLPIDFKTAGMEDLQVSRVIFYVGTKESQWTGKCYENPFHKKVTNCLQVVGEKFQPLTVNPIQDLAKAHKLSDELKAKLSVVGIWIFADSDNSKSESTAYLQELSTQT